MRHQFNCWTKAQAIRLRRELEKQLDEQLIEDEIDFEDWTVEPFGLDIKPEPMVYLWLDWLGDNSVVQQFIESQLESMAVPGGFRDSLEWLEIKYYSHFDN